MWTFATNHAPIKTDFPRTPPFRAPLEAPLPAPLSSDDSFFLPNAILLTEKNCSYEEVRYLCQGR